MTARIMKCTLNDEALKFHLSSVFSPHELCALVSLLATCLADQEKIQTHEFVDNANTALVKIMLSLPPETKTNVEKTLKEMGLSFNFSRMSEEEMKFFLACANEAVN